MNQPARMPEQSARMSANPEPSPGQAPEHKVHYGRVDVAVWRRQAEGHTWYSFSLSRSYKDKDEQWQRTSSLDEEDLLPAALALQEAYAWSQAQRQRGRDDAFRELRPPPSTPSS